MASCYTLGMTTDSRLPSTPAACDGTETVLTEDGPEVVGCTRRGCICKRYAPGFPGFTQQMLDEAAKADEEW